MALEKDQIIKNATTFFGIAEKYEVLNDEAISEMSDKIIKSPASLKFCAYEGGLIEFILEYAKLAISINDSMADGYKVDKKSLVKTVLLHQVSKYMLFQENGNGGYSYVRGLSNIDTGARSAKFALEHGIKISEAEFSTLISIDNPHVSHDNSACVIIRTAITLAMKKFSK